VAKKTVLIVDDEQFIRLLVTQTLEREYTVLEAKDGQEAVDVAKRKKPDLILMDGQMPVMTGLEATRKIRQFEESDPKTNRSHIPIIAITAHAMKEDREMFLKNGMDDYITKPIKRSALMQSILSLIIGNDTSSATNEKESNTIPDPV